MKISLGTVQFGSDYGAFNVRGQVPLTEVGDLLALASKFGVTELDTARAYGDAEHVLATLNAPSKFNVISKCPALTNEGNPAASLISAFKSTLSTLKIQKISGYLLHNAEDLMRPGVYSALLDLRNSGQVDRVGFSGYEIQDALKLCQKHQVDVIQLPANVLDPWYENVEFPPGVELHVRSAFLQGFLLSTPENLPDHLRQFSGLLREFRSDAQAQGLTALEAALVPLLVNPQITKVVVGADSLHQLSEILHAAKKLDGHKPVKFGPYKDASRDLTDPRRWRAKL